MAQDLKQQKQIELELKSKVDKLEMQRNDLQASVNSLKIQVAKLTEQERANE